MVPNPVTNGTVDPDLPRVLSFVSYEIWVTESRVFGEYLEQMFLDSGYLTLQTLLDQSILETNQKALGLQVPPLDVTFSILKTEQASFVANLSPYYFVLSFHSPFALLLFSLVTDREDKIKQGMKVKQKYTLKHVSAGY